MLGRAYGQLPQNPVRNSAGAGVALLVTVALIYAVVRGDGLLTACLGVFLATSAVAAFYQRFAGRNLVLVMRTRPRRLFPDQQVQLAVGLENRSRLPLPWLRLALHLPQAVQVPDLHLERTPVEQVARLPLTLGGRARIERRVSMVFPERGVHRLGPAEVTLTDPLGLDAQTHYLPQTTDVLVYPRLMPLSAALRESLPMGERRGRSFIDEQSRYLGPRPYQPTDPLRRIDWRQTARRGDLFVRTYETVATTASAIFLDPTTARDTWDGIDVAVLERTVSMTASLAHHLIGRGEAVGLYVTGIFSEAAGRRPFFYREPPRSGARQLGRILEALAQVRPPGLFRDLPRILLEELPHLDYQVHVIVIAPYLTWDLRNALQRAARDHRTHFLATGPRDPRDAPVPPKVLPLSLDGLR